MNIMKHIGALLLALLLAPMMGIARVCAPQGCDALNVQGTHEGSITRTAEGALAAHLVVKPGTDPAAQVELCDASSEPLGTVYDDKADGEKVTVELPGSGCTRLCIASKAIAAGVRVYCTAGGKLTDAVVTGAYLYGKSITAAAADGDEFEVLPLSPVVNP